jgi:hypothetical protein
VNWFDRVKFYYEECLWSIERVRNVVGKVINEQEYREITGSDYDA